MRSSAPRLASSDATTAAEIGSNCDEPPPWSSRGRYGTDVGSAFVGRGGAIVDMSRDLAAVRAMLWEGRRRGAARPPRVLL